MEMTHTTLNGLIMTPRPDLRVVEVVDTCIMYYSNLHISGETSVLRSGRQY